MRGVMAPAESPSRSLECFVLADDSDALASFQHWLAFSSSMMPALHDSASELSKRVSLLNLRRTKETPSSANKPPADNYCAPGYAPGTDIQLIAQLPDDILILIFEQCHAGRFTYISHNLSSVCRYWRALAVGTPSLWTPIVFAEEGHPDYLDCARVYLQRSKGYPVEIFVNCGMGNLLEKFWDVLVPHLHHCRALHIEGDGGALYADVERLGSVDTPLLETLEIANTFPHLHSDHATWSAPPPQPLFPASNLRRVRMDMIDLHHIEATRYFYLRNVTSFWFRWELPTDMDGEPPEATVDTHVSRIVEAMPELRELTLTCWDTAADTSMVPLLNELPSSLTSLDLSGISIAWDPIYGDWQHRDFSCLQTIKMSFSSTVNPTHTDLFTLLGLTPNLKELYIGVVDLLPHPWKSVQPVRLPHLENLTLDWVGKSTIEAFLQNLAAPALKKTTFIVSRPYHTDLDDYGHDAVVPPFWMSCPGVEAITLSHGCTLFRSQDLVGALRAVLTNVKTLDLRGHSKWDDELLIGLGTAPWACPALETVSFAYMPDLTQDALEYFLQARRRGHLAGECSAIMRVGMRGCSRLRATEALEGIVKEVWHWI